MSFIDRSSNYAYQNVEVPKRKWIFKLILDIISRSAHILRFLRNNRTNGGGVMKILFLFKTYDIIAVNMWKFNLNGFN